MVLVTNLKQVAAKRGFLPIVSSNKLLRLKDVFFLLSLFAKQRQEMVAVGLSLRGELNYGKKKQQMKKSSSETMRHRERNKESIELIGTGKGNKNMTTE